MSRILVQIGESTWVDPDSIQAVRWNIVCDYPELLLSGGGRVLATSFVEMASAATPNNAQACTNALLDLLKKKSLEIGQQT